MVVYGAKVVIGVPEKILPIHPTLQGIMRLRFRNGRVAAAFVKNGPMIKQHFLQDCGDHWELLPSSAMNVSLRRRPAIMDSMKLTEPSSFRMIPQRKLDCVATDGCKATVQTIHP